PGPPRRSPRPLSTGLRLVHRRLRHTRSQTSEGAARRTRGRLMDVAAWLGGLGLGRYETAFRENDVDAQVLPELTAEDLISIGVTSVGHRRKLLAAIAALGAVDVPPPPGLPNAPAGGSPLPFPPLPGLDPGLTGETRVGA